jgi:hypothetical protein
MNIDAKILNKNTCKSNSTIHLKNHIPWSSLFSSINIRILQHM